MLIGHIGTDFRTVRFRTAGFARTYSVHKLVVRAVRSCLFHLVHRHVCGVRNVSKLLVRSYRVAKRSFVVEETQVQDGGSPYPPCILHVTAHSFGTYRCAVSLLWVPVRFPAVTAPS